MSPLKYPGRQKALIEHLKEMREDHLNKTPMSFLKRFRIKCLNFSGYYDPDALRDNLLEGYQGPLERGFLLEDARLEDNDAPKEKKDSNVYKGVFKKAAIFGGALTASALFSYVFMKKLQSNDNIDTSDDVPGLEMGVSKL